MKSAIFGVDMFNLQDPLSEYLLGNCLSTKHKVENWRFGLRDLENWTKLRSADLVVEIWSWIGFIREPNYSPRLEPAQHPLSSLDILAAVLKENDRKWKDLEKIGCIEYWTILWCEMLLFENWWNWKLWIHQRNSMLLLYIIGSLH